MSTKARQLRGSLRNLVSELTKDDAVVRDLLKTAIQETVTAEHTGKDHKWIAGRVEKMCDQVFEHRDRY